MTTTKTKTLLASQIKTSNLITYTLIHEQVQTNFKIIAQALSIHDDQFNNIKLANQKLNTKVDQLSSLLNNVDNRLKQQQMMSNLLNEKSNNFTDKSGHLDKKIQNIINDVQKLKESDKVKTARQAVQNPQQKGKNNANTLQISNEKFENLMKITNGHQQMLKKICDKVDRNEKDIKNNQDFLNKEIQTLRKQIISIGKASDAQNIWKDINQIKEQLGDYYIKDQLQKIQNNFKQYEYENNKKFNDINQELNKLKLSLQQQKRLRLKNSQELWKINDIVFKIEADKLDNSGINNDKFVDMEKDILELKKKMNLIFSFGGRENDLNNFGHKTTNSFNRFQNTETKISQDHSPSKNFGDTDIKAELLTRMKQQKQEMLKAIKKADHNSSQNDKNRFLLLEDAIKRLQHIVNGKADNESLKKLISHIQNKINYVFHMVSNPTEEDAIIARKNWFCLSCDKKLQHYKGKVGVHLSSSQQLKGQQIRQQVVGGGMSMRSKSKIDLPSVSKGKK